ncbi:YbhB/YbcL family Raf kinase inhibitor-like protein [Psychromonas sp. Urea-02u-13]|uniref:YbhB/YbcL family Raf kinase inhibitor-like protein n=1 Tax=Psychromonas sp. Urea-02u-13 TaxID=2058326 RepID=UPI000C33E2B6|nr:YbhB/YbcL family Raf kinase inhibitor-like protein [Psychromonas sp. Urea-02u-13]PKG39425.1 YbhB/YbcL family Raf kinase inhibitor-like protein [Psychromonas sp. Urea-02u-13]
MRQSLKILSALSLSLSVSAFAGSLTLSSQDISQGELMDKNQEFVGFGCSGGNLSPQLTWENAPKNTKSFAITAYDHDAPTGSGWWHWQVVNIPSNVSTLGSNAGSTTENLLPAGSVQIQNDYGSRGFGGACPPAGHGVHHYQFTIHALSVEKLELPDNASGALAGYMINANSIESSTIESLYKRD